MMPTNQGRGSEVYAKVTSIHPCFSKEACRQYARVHLPVAPKCNLQCNYCSRRFDCVNESRPGVTSEVLGPEEALLRLEAVLSKIPQTRVVGIAGPGEPLFNPQTFATFKLVKQHFPSLLLCVSTNGWLLAQEAERLRDIGVDAVTVTVNALTPEVGREVYEWVLVDGQKLCGEEAASVLIARQWAGIERAASLGFRIKVNAVIIPGINIEEIPQIAQRAKEAGATILNLISLIPVAGTKFAQLNPPSGKLRRELQDLCEPVIHQMRHCQRCRADAVGFLGHDVSRELFPTSA